MINSINNAQVDTTVLYPLDLGNYWEFTNYTDSHWYEKVVGEEIMPNGLSYKKLVRVDLIHSNNYYKYIRVEDNVRVFRYWHDIDNPCEQKVCDFSLPVGSIWMLTGSGWYKGIYDRHYIDYDLIMETVLMDNMGYYLVDSAKVPPDTTEIIDIYDNFTKGVGPTLYGWPTIMLTGLIVKGVKYGYISTDISDTTPTNDYMIDISVYPNPFNSSATISFTNPKPQYITIDVYNLLGERVKTLIENHSTAGPKQIILQMSPEWSSGVYIVLLKTSETSYHKKIIYLK